MAYETLSCSILQTSKPGKKKFARLGTTRSLTAFYIDIQKIKQLLKGSDHHNSLFQQDSSMNQKADTERIHCFDAAPALTNSSSVLFICSSDKPSKRAYLSTPMSGKYIMQLKDVAAKQHKVEGQKNKIN